MPITAKTLHQVLAKRGQDYGPAMGPNQRVPSYMQQVPTSTTTPMNGTRPVAADVPKLPAVPAVPPLPGMPSAPISSPAASGAPVPGPNKNVAQFAKSATDTAPTTAGSVIGDAVHAIGDHPAVAGAGAAVGFGAGAVLEHILHTKMKRQPKMAAEAVDQHVDPGFARAMAAQQTKGAAQAAALAAKAKAVQPVGFKPNPIPGFGKMNSAKVADEYCAPGTIKPEPKTNLKSPLPKAGLMKTEKKTAANPLPIPGATNILGKVLRGLGSAGEDVAQVAKAYPKATGAVALGAGTAAGAPLAAATLQQAAKTHPMDAVKAFFAQPKAAPVAPVIEPSAWDKIKATGGDVLGKTTDYFKGFGQNPMNYDTSHLIGAGVAALGAGALLHHLLKGRKAQEPAYED